MAIIKPTLNVGPFQGPDGKNVWIQVGQKMGIRESGGFAEVNRKGALLEMVAFAKRLNGWNWTLTTLPGGLAEIEAEAGFQYGFNQVEVPEEIWEMDAQETPKSILLADFPNSSIVLTSKLTREALSKIIQNSDYVWQPALVGIGGIVLSGTTTDLIDYAFDNGVNSAAEPDLVHLPSADYAPAYSLYLLMKAGVTEFPEDSPTIQHTLIVSSIYQIQASYINFGRIISSGSMISVEGFPNWPIFTVPSITPTAEFVETPGDLQYGWKKSRPRITSLSRNKTRIVQNYQFGLWPIKLFGMVL